MVPIRHEQSIVCSKTSLDSTTHEQTIICRQLFANIAFKVGPGGFFYGQQASMAPLFLFFLPTFSSPARRFEPLDTNAGCILLSGILAVTTFEITFLGSGVG